MYRDDGTVAAAAAAVAEKTYFYHTHTTPKIPGVHTHEAALSSAEEQSEWKKKRMKMCMKIWDMYSILHSSFFCRLLYIIFYRLHRHTHTHPQCDRVLRVVVPIDGEAKSFSVCTHRPIACVRIRPEKMLAVLKAIESLFRFRYSSFHFFPSLSLSLCPSVGVCVYVSELGFRFSTEVASHWAYTLLIVMKFILYVAFSLCLHQKHRAPLTKIPGLPLSISVRHNSFTDDSSACRLDDGGNIVGNIIFGLI